MPGCALLLPSPGGLAQSLHGPCVVGLACAGPGAHRVSLAHDGLAASRAGLAQDGTAASLGLWTLGWSCAALELHGPWRLGLTHDG